MPFTRHAISNSRITLHGPEEHVGETRYSWLGPFRRGRNPPADALWFRVCRVRGHEIDVPRDPFSLIVSFEFSEQSITVRVHGTEAVPDHKLVGVSVLNVYTNTVQSQWHCPVFEIPFNLLVCGDYYVGHRSDYQGDFLVLVGKSKDDGPAQQVIILNLDTLLMLEGMDKVSLAGDGYYLGENMGTIPSDTEGLALPLFANIVGEQDDSYGFGVIDKFAPASYARSLEIVRKGIVASRCAVIDFEVYNDRGSMDSEKGLRDMKEAFADFFAQS
jgi:hypothetical protein